MNLTDPYVRLPNPTLLGARASRPALLSSMRAGRPRSQGVCGGGKSKAVYRGSVAPARGKLSYSRLIPHRLPPCRRNLGVDFKLMTKSIANQVHRLRCRLRIRENHAMGTGQRFLLVIATIMLPACHAAAQTLPCPTDSPRAAPSASPWPGDRAPPASSAPAPAMSPMGVPAMAAPSGRRRAAPPCLAGFATLRDDLARGWPPA